jgi:histidine triad (HIT) family protein
MNREPDKSCLFCRIVRGEITARKVFEDEEALGFQDINPQAPVHIVVIPKKHISSLSEAEPDDAALLGRLQLAIAGIAEKTAGKGNGYRVVLNHGKDAGQSVFHIHYHLLAGRKFGWPPG